MISATDYMIFMLERPLYTWLNPGCIYEYHVYFFLVKVISC